MGYNNVGDIMKIKDLVLKLIDREKTISSMESCTGGGVANAITNIEGASDVFHYSAVTYANEFKIKMGVAKEVIDTLNATCFPINKTFDYKKIKINLLMSDVF